jgi:glycosyltransferase involved in cell wall biosynthesis
VGKKQQIRVCHISTVHPLNDVRVFYRECCSLAEAGYEVHLIIQAEKPFVKERVHIHPIWSAKSRILRMLFMPWVAMIKALRIKASIYHYHDPELILMGFVLRWIFGKKVVFDIHESVARQVISKHWLPKWSRKPIAIFYKSIERMFIPGQALVLASQYIMSDYSPASYLVRNYPLISEDLLRMVNERKRHTDVPLLVYVGYVARIRGAMVYVKLAGKLAERGYDFRMEIIGQYSKELGRELRARIEELQLQEKVLLRGRLDWMDAMRFVSQATIGMCLLLPVPNYKASLATKILEYMMLGTPVLASDFDCWRDFVEGERTGMMADPTKIDEVVGVCEQMLSKPDELAAMGKRGMEAVRSKYNWSTEFKELLRCYNDLLNR